MGAPRLRPGTPMQTRPSPDGLDARTPRSKWHSVLNWWAPGKHYMTRNDDGEWKDESGWSAERRAGVDMRRVARSTRAQRRDELRLARHAQDLREEAVTHGGRTERAAFYGTGREHVGRGTERRTRTTAADNELEADARPIRHYVITTRGGQTYRTSAYTPGAARSKIAARHPDAQIVRVVAAGR